MSFKFDESAFRREIQKQAQSAIDDLAKKRTRQLDELRRQYVGRPPAEIKPALQRIFSQDDGSITDPELSEYAQAISNGTRITFNAQKIRW